MKCKVLLLTFFFIIIGFNLSEAQMVPAIYVFGDSLVDVGNNNYLKLSLAKADLPHYGIDFPNQKANGRFTNGMNAADFLGKLIKHISLLFFYLFIFCSLYLHVLESNMLFSFFYFILLLF